MSEIRIEPMRPDPSGNGAPPTAGNIAERTVEQDPAVLAPRFEPFPIASLPGLLRDYVTAAADSIGCDDTLVALPGLSAMAAAIGNTRAVILKPSWIEPSVLWTASTARSGGWKSPAFHRVLHHVAVLQAKALAEYREKNRKWEEAKRHYEEALADYRRRKGPRPKPFEEEEPRPVEYFVDDITTESLALKLRDNPRGLLGAPEELSGYFGGMDAYKKAHVDASRYLRMYDANFVKVDRKTGNKEDRIIFVRRAAVSITGTIQTRILARCATPEYFASGMMARFIIAQPPLIRPEWSEAEIPPEVEKRFAALIERLYELKGLREEGEEDLDEKDVQSMRPHALYLTRDAKRRWVEFFNEFRFEEDSEDPQQSALWAKTVGRAARVALVHHVVTEVCARRDATAPITLESMEAGIKIARWSLKEGERVYGILAREARRGGEEVASTPQDQDKPLLEWIASRGGAVTPRDLQRGPQRFRKSGVDPEAHLQELVDRGHGIWGVRKHPGPGRPTREFRLSPPTRGDEMGCAGDGNGENPGDEGVFVSVAASPGGSSPEREPGDETPQAGEEVTWEG